MDIQELKDSIEVALEHFELNEKTLKKGDDIGRAICELSLRYINEGIDVKDIYFDYTEIYKEVWGKDVDANKASADVRRHMKTTSECFAAQSPLNLMLKKRGKSQLNLIIEASTGRRKTQISLSVTQRVNTRYSSNSEIESVLYSIVRLPKIYPITKPFLDMELKLFKVMMVSMVLVVLSLMAILSFLNVVNWTDGLLKIILIAAFFPCAYILLKLKEILDKGITELPTLMAPIRTRNAMLVLYKDRTKGNVSLKMKAVTFEAQCCVCGEDIVIEKSKEFNGRFIGKCTVAPTEHIFSFDHVTKTGKFLR
jgi:hypothetical protein